MGIDLNSSEVISHYGRWFALMDARDGMQASSEKYTVQNALWRQSQAKQRG